MSLFQTIFLIATAAPPISAGVDHLIVGTAAVVSQSAPPTARRGYESYVGPTVAAATRDHVRFLEFAPISASIDALARLRTFSTWKVNWDGEGAPAPTLSSIDTATNLLGILDGALIETPKVALNAFGQPMFMLAADGAEMSATIVSPKTIHFYVSKDDFEAGGVARVKEAVLPSTFLQALRSAGLAHV